MKKLLLLCALVLGSIVSKAQITQINIKDLTGRSLFMTLHGDNTIPSSCATPLTDGVSHGIPSSFYLTLTASSITWIGPSMPGMNSLSMFVVFIPGLGGANFVTCGKTTGSYPLSILGVTITANVLVTGPAMTIELM